MIIKKGVFVMINTDDIILELLDSDGKLKALLKQKIEKAISELDYKKIATIIEKRLIDDLSQLDYSDMFNEDIFVDMGKKIQNQMNRITFNIEFKKDKK